MSELSTGTARPCTCLVRDRRFTWPQMPNCSFTLFQSSNINNAAVGDVVLARVVGKRDTKIIDCETLALGSVIEFSHAL